MIARLLLSTALLLATYSTSSAAPRTYRDVDVPNSALTGELLQFFGTPAEATVISEQIILGPPATLRWTYYFAGRRGTVHRANFYFVEGRCEKRDLLSADHYERLRLLHPEVVADARAILRYKRSHGR